MIRNQLKKVICVDIDGSISNDDTRRHLAPALGSPAQAWEAFHQACVNDTPVMGVVALTRALHPTHQIHFVSARPAHLRSSTEAWLAHNNVLYDVLRLYSENDRPKGSAEFKTQYVLQLKKQNLEPILFIEDLPQVADYIEQHAGIPVLCVKPRYKISSQRPVGT